MGKICPMKATPAPEGQASTCVEHLCQWWDPQCQCCAVAVLAIHAMDQMQRGRR